MPYKSDGVTYHTSTHTRSGNDQELSPSCSFNQEEWNSTTDEFEGQVGSPKDLGQVMGQSDGGEEGLGVVCNKS